MPIYEYECKKCGHRFEKIQKFSDPLETKCPKCRGKLEQVITAPAVQFKGSGWYVTDYARKGSAPHTESKPESKPETKSDDSKPKVDSKKEKKK